jgi:TPR repeat protein
MAPARVALLAFALGALACGPSPRDPAPAAEAPAAVTPPERVAAPEREPEPSAAPVAAPPTPGTGECSTGEDCHAAAVLDERENRPARALALYARACDRGSARSCHRAGELLRDGLGVTVDEQRARQLFEQGCQRGSPAACDALGH